MKHVKGISIDQVKGIDIEQTKELINTGHANDP